MCAVHDRLWRTPPIHLTVQVPGYFLSWAGGTMTAAEIEARLRDARQQKRWPDGIAASAEFVALQPDDPYAWALRGNVILDSEDYVRALDAFDRVLVLRPDDWIASFNRGIAFRHLGRVKEALAAFEASSTTNPGSAEARTTPRGAARKSRGRRRDLRLPMRRSPAIVGTGSRVQSNHSSRSSRASSPSAPWWRLCTACATLRCTAA
ncbi:MAG: tetratricopeptide repeat protein [Polyangiales bacterium]